MDAEVRDDSRRRALHGRRRRARVDRPQCRQIRSASAASPLPTSGRRQGRRAARRLRLDIQSRHAAGLISQYLSRLNKI